MYVFSLNEVLLSMITSQLTIALHNINSTDYVCSIRAHTSQVERPTLKTHSLEAVHTLTSSVANVHTIDCTRKWIGNAVQMFSSSSLRSRDKIARVQRMPRHASQGF